MGIKTNISLKDLPKKYQNFELIPTKNGVKDSVYLLGDKFVLKIFEDENCNLESEKRLLNYIRDLDVIQIVEELKVGKKNSIVYKQLDGESILTPNNTHIKEIAKFLKEFHSVSKEKTSKNRMIFNKNILKVLIDNSGNKLIQNYFKKIVIELKNDGIIHGDIFPDNVYFLGDKISGVMDFSEACNGDFLFDLAVVAISWCFDDEILNSNKLNTLLKTYDSNIKKDIFLNYMQYALLYYATTRYLDNRDYKQLLTRLEGLLQ